MIAADLSDARAFLVLSHPKGALLDSDLVTEETSEVQLIVMFNQFETCCMIMLDVAIIRWIHFGHKVIQTVPRKCSPQHYTTSTCLNSLSKAGWVHGFLHAKC